MSFKGKVFYYYSNVVRTGVMSDTSVTNAISGYNLPLGPPKVRHLTSET